MWTPWSIDHIKTSATLKIYQNSDKELNKNLQKEMKPAAATIVAVASAQGEKKVPPRHPLQRLNKLNIFAGEWCNANLSEKAAAHWTEKFGRNVARFERRFELCGFYDENQLPHGGPKPEDRKRREDDDLAFLDCEGALCPRYDKNNPVRGIQQITKGFAKWAQRYVSTCKLQPAKQVDRSNKWFGQLTGKLEQ